MHSIVTSLRLRGLSQDVLDGAVATAERSERPLRSVLIDDQIVTEFELASAIAEAYAVEAVELHNITVDPAAMKKLPLALARRHEMIPVSMNDSTISVAVLDPGNVLALDDVRAVTGMTVRPLVVTHDDLTRLLDRAARDSNDLSAAAEQILADESAGALPDTIKVDEEAAPVVRYVNGLLERAIGNRASDIHLEPGEYDLRVRLRIDGVLHEDDAVPQGVQNALISRMKIMSGLDITERRVPQNGRITMSINGRGVDLRVATLPTVWGEKIVLRILDTGGIDLNLKKLGFTDYNYERYARSFRKPHGMVLVTGPTGSGKSTTLYATLAEIARPEVNVITVEDPVEYRIAGINQVQVNPKAGLTFASVLAAILRSDPDIVLVGEIRDGSTAQIAVEAALTGHTVLSTLHTNDAPSAITRLTEMGIEPFLVGSSLDGVLAQRLARRLCEWCKEPYTPDEQTLVGSRWPREKLAVPAALYRAVGCRSCANTGYKGRLAVNEIMPMSPELEHLTVQRAPSTELAKVALAQGMVTLREDGLLKTAQGLTTVEEVMRVTV